MGQLTLFIFLTLHFFTIMVINKYLIVIMVVEVPILQPAISPITSSLEKMKAPPPSVVMALPPPPPNKGTCKFILFNQCFHPAFLLDFVDQ